MRRPLVVLGLGAVGIAAGLFSLHLARKEPAFWFARDTAGGAVALLAAGWTAIAAGLGSWLWRPGSRFGPLLTAAGFAWFLLEWNNPGSGSALVFTTGLVLYASCPPIVAHAVLARG